jgi:starch phosphorylase
VPGSDGSRVTVFRKVRILVSGYRFLRGFERNSVSPKRGVKYGLPRFGVHGLRSKIDTVTPANEIRIAYFSMEIAADAAWPTYSGGLGVLAGDMLRSAADMGLPMAGVTLLSRQGYFHQHLDAQGQQREEPEHWQPEAVLQRLEPVVAVRLEGREVKIRAWAHTISGLGGHRVPVYFLDTDLPENSTWDRTLTDKLYGGDDFYRLCQETILGIGGVRLLRALGHMQIARFHMNEGHSALLTVALIEEELGERKLSQVTTADIERVRQKCVFTTHTPVPAGFDKFPLDLATRVLGQDIVDAFVATQCCPSDLNMTYLGLRCSRYINGVAMRHGEISHTMFPNYPMHAITNGVHAATWTSAPFQELYDHHVPEWRRDNLYLRYAVGISLKEIQQAHKRAKQALLRAIGDATGVHLAEDVATIGFARRAAEYKRADLIFSDLQRLRQIREKSGAFQILFSGKAHPKDEGGKAEIRKIIEAGAALRDSIPVVYVENYDMRWAALFTAGVDLWLNTPHRPYEASGTSGMKAALNGVPSLSVRDGWWIEGHFEGVTGWSVGFDEDPEQPAVEIASLYDKLENLILPMFYKRPDAYAEVMRSAIAVNGSFFNTQRMISQYLWNAYFPGTSEVSLAESANAADPSVKLTRNT